VREKDLILPDLVVVEDPIGRFRFRVAIASGRKLEGRLLVHGVEDDSESPVEAFITNVGRGQLIENPFLHRTIRWQGPSDVLFGLIVVPGRRKLTRRSQLDNIT
jgi:hypothetical protein